MPGRAAHVSDTDGGGGLTCSSVAGGAPGGLLAGGWGLLVVPAPGAFAPAPRACPAPGWAAGEAGDPAPGVADPAPSVGSVCCGGGTTASVSSSASFCGAAATSDGALHSCDTTMRNCPSCFATSATTSSFTRCSNCFATSPETVCCMVSAIAADKARTPLKTSLVSTCSDPRAAAPRAALDERTAAQLAPPHASPLARVTGVDPSEGELPGRRCSSASNSAVVVVVGRIGFLRH